MAILTIRQRGDWLVAGFNIGRLTEASTVRQAAGELIAALEDVPLRGNAAISFEGVEQASSQVAAMLRAARALVVDDRFGRLALCRVGPSVSELLRLTGLENAFERFERLRDIVGDSERRTASACAAVMPGGKAYETRYGAGMGGETTWID